MKLTGYLRVSTGRQAEEGDGLEVQRADIERWAEAEGHVIISWHQDQQTGKAGVDKRFGLADALLDVGSRRARGIVVQRLDRIARDLILQEQLLASIWSDGGRVFSTSPGEAPYLVKDGPDDPSRALIRQVLGAVSQYERSMIRLRLRAGRERKRAAGGYAYGRPPYGWRAEGKALVHDPEEQEVVERVKDLRIKKGLLLREVADVLNASGYTNRVGGPWSGTQVSRIEQRLKRQLAAKRAS